MAEVFETPRAQCAVCGCRVSLAMNSPYEPDLKQGYRCTDCEQPFCAVCIKGDKHTSKWKAPCRDDELEAWASAVVEAPQLRASLAAAHACVEAADRIREAWGPIADYDAARAHYDRVRATPAGTDAKPGRE